MGDTKIEWTDKTWNPIRGCSRVSEGCRHCYAERLAARFGGSLAEQDKSDFPYYGLAEMTKAGPRWSGEVQFIEEHLADPLRWKKPRRIFVNSMSDLFHEKVELEWLTRICDVMCQAKQHVFQVLTKRPQRMKDYLSDVACFGGNPPGHIWWGVSVEDQSTADERIPLLLQTPAAVRWVSYEPVLGPVDFNAIPGPDGDHLVNIAWREPDSWERVKLDWIVCGGESGPGARPLNPDWARSVRDQCQAAGVPFFFKQWGEFTPNVLGVNDTFPPECVGKKAAGRNLDGREWNEYPR